MRIFEDIERINARPGGDSEPFYTFLNRVAGPYWDQVRQVIERWFECYPESEKQDLGSRLKDRKDSNSWAALWELYLHEMFRGAGYRVECHPDLDETGRRPDFLVSDSNTSFYVEARRISSTATTAVDNMRNSLYDEINKIDSPNFFLGIEMRSEGVEAPSGSKLRKKIVDWLNSLDPDDYMTDEDVALIEVWPKMHWEDRGWRLAFQAIPKSPDKRGLPNRRAIGVYPFQMSFPDDATPIRRALKVKGSKYGRLAKPYVIALAISSFTYEDDDMDSSLFGSTVEQVSFDGSSRMFRADDGYWRDGAGAKHDGVSAILVAHNSNPGNWASMAPSLWENPNFDPLIPRLPCWRRIRMDGIGKIVDEPTELPNSILGIPSTWPEGERFPRA